MRLLLIGLALAAVIYLVTDGSLLFLPLLFILPLGLFGRRRRAGYRRGALR